MFKGYISHSTKQVRWIINEKASFLIPYLGRVHEIKNNDFFTIIKKDNYKIICEFKIPQADNEQAYLVKIYKYPHLFQRIKNLLKHTRTFREFNTTYITGSRGISVEVPVAHGEEKRLFIKKSYLIIKKIKDSCTLREYFKNNALLEERRRVLRKFGKLAKEIHDAGIKQDDFSLDNFLIYKDAEGKEKIILIDFERVSVQAGCLNERLCTWYLAKLNRAKNYFSNADRLRFLMAYTNGDYKYCKRLAQQIESITIRIQKKDARKFHVQSICENRKFGVFKNSGFYGLYKKKYQPETLLTILKRAEETDETILYTNQFQILRLFENPAILRGQGIFRRTWMHANALFALRINVPIPAGLFIKTPARKSNEGFLISETTGNCIPLNKYPDFNQNKDKISFALLQFVKQIASFGMLSKDIKASDILVQISDDRRLKCYLGNYKLFCINHFSVQRNMQINLQLVERLLKTNDNL